MKRFFIRSPYLERQEIAWQLGCHESGQDPSEWVAARVPGGAQLDFAFAHGRAEFHRANAWEWFAGLEDRYWTYRARVGPQDLPRRAGDRVHLVCEGIDYECTILIDDREVHHQRGLHVPVDLDLTEHLRADCTVEVRIHPAPKADTTDAWGEEWAKQKRTQASHVTKPSVSYGDDFHPRVIPLGMWQPAYLDIRPVLYIADAHVDYRLADDFTSADVWMDVELSSDVDAATLVWGVRARDGGAAVTFSGRVDGSRARVGGRIENPRLWWPHDHGAPHMYDSELSLVDERGQACDVQRSAFGLRRVRLIMHEGAWDFPRGDRWPKTRSNPPIAIEVNGRTIFGRGACCVPMNVFFGTVTADDCDALVRLGKAANFNMLRISGGCVAFKPAFYDACDLHGLLVWQDFPLACNQYPDTDDYLTLLDDESRALITRLRQHPAIALWCGGNELFEIHSGMTDQSLALRLLNRNTFELDRDRPFLASTPDMGIAHGPYELNYVVDDEIVEGHALLQRAGSTAYPEFGCPAPASVSVLEAIIPADELFPPRAGTTWQDHKGFFAFVEREETWLNLPTLARYVDLSGSLQALVDGGQQLQGETLKAIFEEARRQSPTCSLALVWCFNEPWPNAANLSLLCWPRVPKAGFRDVAAACRPALVSARVERLLWRPGERFEAELWLLSDSPAAIARDTVDAFIVWRSGEQHLGEWQFEPLPPQHNRRGPRLEIDLPADAAGTFELSLRCRSLPHLNSSYRFWTPPRTAS